MCSLLKPPTPWVHVFSEIYLLPSTMVLHPPPVTLKIPCCAWESIKRPM